MNKEDLKHDEFGWVKTQIKLSMGETLDNTEIIKDITSYNVYSDENTNMEYLMRPARNVVDKYFDFDKYNNYIDRIIENLSGDTSESDIRFLLEDNNDESILDRMRVKVNQDDDLKNKLKSLYEDIIK